MNEYSMRNQNQLTSIMLHTIVQYFQGLKYNMCQLQLRGNKYTDYNAC